MNISHKKLSIIVPCYNEKNNIARVIAQVLKSPIANKEIIVVDDCSTEAKLELIFKIKALTYLLKIMSASHISLRIIYCTKRFIYSYYS